MSKTKRGRKSRIAKQRERLELTMKLDYLLLSDVQLQKMKETKAIQGQEIGIYVNFLMNFNTNTRYLNRRRPSKIGAELDIHPSYVNRAAKTFNACGLADMEIKNMTVCGKLRLTAKECFAKSEYDETQTEIQEEIVFVNPQKLTASMIDRHAVDILLKAKLTKIQWLVALYLPIHCHLQSGTIHEQRTVDIAKWIGCHRTSVDRAIDKLNAIGYCQIKRDYALSGRLPYTAYAYNQNNLKKKAKAAAKKEPRRGKAVAMGFARARDLLMNAYGIVNERFLRTTSEVKELAELLTKQWGIQSIFYGESQPSASQPGASQSVGEVLLPFAEAPQPDSI